MRQRDFCVSAPTTQKERNLGQSVTPAVARANAALACHLHAPLPPAAHSPYCRPFVAAWVPCWPPDRLPGLLQRRLLPLLPGAPAVPRPPPLLLLPCRPSTAPSRRERSLLQRPGHSSPKCLNGSKFLQCWLKCAPSNRVFVEFPLRALPRNRTRALSNSRFVKF